MVLALRSISQGCAERIGDAVLLRIEPGCQLSSHSQCRRVLLRYTAINAFVLHFE